MRPGGDTRDEEEEKKGGKEYKDIPSSWRRFDRTGPKKCQNVSLFLLLLLFVSCLYLPPVIVRFQMPMAPL